MSKLFSLTAPWRPRFLGETFEARMRDDPTWYRLVFMGWDATESGRMMVRARALPGENIPVGECVEMRPWSPR